MATGTPLEQIVKSLAFEVEAVAQDASSGVIGTSKDMPLNVKVKVRKKEESNLSQGFLSVPRMNNPDKPPERIRLISSDQTIMSFNMVMEGADFTKKPKKKPRKLFGGCLGTKHDDDEYAYAPKTKTMLKSDGEHKKSIIIISEVNDNSTGIVKPYVRDFGILGKCRPGGCLDPPFSEDKYQYGPTKKEQSFPTKTNTAEKIKEQIKVLNNDTKQSTVSDEQKKFDGNKPINTKQNAKNIPIVHLYEAETMKDSLDSKYSDSIITYPPAESSSTNLIGKNTRGRISEEKQRKSNDESILSFFKPTSRPRESIHERDSKDSKKYKKFKETNLGKDFRQNEEIKKVTPKDMTRNEIKLTTIPDRIILPSTKEKLALQTENSFISLNSKDTNVSHDTNQTTARHKSGDEMVSKETKDAMIQQINKDKIDPQTNEMISQGPQDALNSTKNEPEIVVQKSKDAMVTQKTKNELDSQRNKDKIISQETKDEIISQGTKDGIISQGIQDEFISRGTKNEIDQGSITFQKSKDRTASQKSIDTRVSQRTKDRMVSQESKDGLIPHEAKEKYHSEKTKNNIFRQKLKDRLDSQETKDRTNLQKNEDEINSKETQYEIITQENKNAIIQQETKDEMYLQRTENDIISQGSNDAMKSPGAKNQMFTEESKDGIISQGTNDRTVFVESKNTMINQETLDMTVSKKSKDRMDFYETKDEMVSQESRSVETNQETKLDMITQKNIDEIVSQENKISMISQKNIDKIVSQENKIPMISPGTQQAIVNGNNTHKINQISSSELHLEQNIWQEIKNYDEVIKQDSTSFDGSKSSKISARLSKSTSQDKNHDEVIKQDNTRFDGSKNSKISNRPSKSTNQDENYVEVIKQDSTRFDGSKNSKISARLSKSTTQDEIYDEVIKEDSTSFDGSKNSKISSRPSKSTTFSQISDGHEVNLNKLRLNNQQSNPTDLQPDLSVSVQNMPDLPEENKNNISSMQINNQILAQETHRRGSKSSLKKDTITLDFGFQSYVNGDKEKIIKTIETSKEPMRYPDDYVTFIKTQIKPNNNEIRISVDLENEMFIQFKRNKSPQRVHISGEKRNRYTIHESEPQNKSNASVFDSLSNSKIGNPEILNIIYEKGLLPLHKSIHGLKKEIDALTKQQTIFKEKLIDPKRKKSYRILDISHNCSCKRH